ncbi:MAG: DUF4065 domain-containing protein [Bacteroidetes bacterium]|nr:DUF4065 domain-containing protein [Bacteroidota bacterium]
MKSPKTGNVMSLMKEVRNMTFRKEEFQIVYHYYLCNDSNEQFTSTELDELNLQQLYNQYRDKHNLPFPEQVQETREMYGLPANKMSEILGFGVNSYRNYENDEVPVHANGKLILLASDPKKFKELVELSETLDEKLKQKLFVKIDHLIQTNLQNKFSLNLENYLLDGSQPDEFTGYKKPNLKKLTEMVVFFTERLEPWKTQMNKLLFYSDFHHFKNNCFSITGTRYRAIEMGPVPYNYDSLFEYLANKNEIKICTTEFPNGSIGEQFKPQTKRTFDNSLFCETELEVLETVSKKFKGLKPSDLIELSHTEIGWKENKEDKKIISYKYAFELIQL